MRLIERNINGAGRLTMRRMLPVKGEVLVQRGQPVTPLQVVARAEVPHRYQVINVARQLAQPQVDMAQVMLKAEGDPVEANEPIAVLQGRLPFVQRSARALAAGHIATIGPGWVLLEIERTVTEVQAFIHGIVSNLVPNRGVVIEASGAAIEAACGFGGEAFGRLKRVVSSPFETINEETLDESMEQSIIVGGRFVTEDVLRQAEQLQIRGIIVGGIDVSLLNLEPMPKVRVVATEGFGQTAMSSYTFGVLTALVGREVSLRGQTSTLATPAMRETGLDTPVILATVSQGSTATLAQLPAKREAEEVHVGTRVRVTRGPFLGTTGQIQAIPHEPRTNNIGLKLPGAQVNIDGVAHFFPWANLEQIV